MFEIHTEAFDECSGDEIPVNKRFTADRRSRILTMTDFDADGAERSVTLDGGKMSTLLRWAVHSLEIFMWAEDYNLNPSQSSVPPRFDLLPEYWPEDWDEEDEEEADDDEPAEDEPEDEISWRVQIEYADETMQEITACGVYLTDRPEDLYHGSKVVDSWSSSGTGSLSLSGSCTVSKGKKYTLTLDATVNGVSIQRASTSGTC